MVKFISVNAHLIMILLCLAPHDVLWKKEKQSKWQHMFHNISTVCTRWTVALIDPGIMYNRKSHG